jgi:predicted nucleotidyltransferase
LAEARSGTCFLIPRYNQGERAAIVHETIVNPSDGPSATHLPVDAVSDQAIARVLDEVVRRVVEVGQPEAILLFGSAARGDMRPGSDLDLLIIKAGAHRRQLAQAIYRRLIGLSEPIDIVVVTPEDVWRYRHCPGMVIESALREGKAIYGTWPSPSG